MTNFSRVTYPIILRPNRFGNSYNKGMGYALGAADCFMKPLNRQQISSAVRKYCRTHREMDLVD